MADSPHNNSSDVLKLIIKIDGSDTTANFKIDSIRVSKSVNRVAKAWLYLIDGDIASQTFPSSDSDDLSPGKTIEVEAGYGDQTSLIYAGIIVRHGIQMTTSGGCRLVIECADEAIKMTFARKHANYVVLASGDEIKDSDVFTTITGNYSGLTTDIDATEPSLTSLVQYSATDWDFIVSRAEVNGMLVYCEDGNFSVKKPDFSTAPLLTVTYGTDLMEFRAQVDSRYQLSQVRSVAWDPTTLQVLEETVSPESDSSSQATKNGDLSSVLGIVDFSQKSSTTQVQQSLKVWAQGQLTKSRLSYLRGQMKFQGNASPKLGSQIEVVGVGERFNGILFCSGIEHRIENGSWSTQVEFGCAPHWFGETENVSSPPAAGLSAAFQGLQIGIVQKLDEDPDGQYRVQVNIPVHQAETEGIWARLSHPYASAGFGSFFIPEIGDEVVLGYFNSDPAYPLIIGSLYSQKNTAPLEHTAENYIKTLVTKSKLKIQFDDDKKILLFETPGGHSITLDDDQQSVTLKDSNDNSVTMNSSGISLQSPKDISLSADGNISLTAGQNVEASATGDATISGMNVSATADTGFSASGNASSEVTSSGTTTVKGSMVMIN